MSQSADAKINIGITGGLNRSTLISNPEGLLHITNKSYYGIGTTATCDLKYQFSIGLSLLYLGKGCKFTIEGQNDVQAAFDLAYIHVPATVSYSLKLPFVSPYISAGFFYEYNISAQLSYKSADFLNKRDVKNDVMDTNCGYIIGCGLKREAGKFVLLIGLYYSKGLQNLYDMDFNTESTLNTGGIQLLAGIEYAII